MLAAVSMWLESNKDGFRRLSLGTPGVAHAAARPESGFEGAAWMEP
jgi:hypothetical protein